MDGTLQVNVLLRKCKKVVKAILGKMCVAVVVVVFVLFFCFVLFCFLFLFLFFY